MVIEMSCMNEKFSKQSQYAAVSLQPIKVFAVTSFLSPQGFQLLFFRVHGYFSAVKQLDFHLQLSSAPGTIPLPLL